MNNDRLQEIIKIYERDGCFPIVSISDGKSLDQEFYEIAQELQELRKQKQLLIEDAERLAECLPKQKLSGEVAWLRMEDSRAYKKHKELMEEVLGSFEWCGAK